MRILIADDHELVRRGVRSVLLKRADFHVCGEAVDGQDAIQQARQLAPDLIVMDISMPNLNGLDATREIRRTLPQIDVLVLSQHDSPEMMRQALNAGARGYVVKSAISAELVASIDKLHRREMAFSQAVPGSADKNLDVQEVLQRSAAFEQALRESEERFRLAQAAAHIGTWEWDPIENNQNLSTELHRIFGTHADDPACTEKWASRVHQHDWPKVSRLMAEGHQAGEMDFEYRYMHPELGLRWLHCQGRRLRHESRMFGVVADITDRKRTEEALRSSEQELRAIVETTPECVKLVSADGSLLHMNAAGLEMVEADGLDAVAGKSIIGLIAPEDRERFEEFNRRICGGEKGTLEFGSVSVCWVFARI